MLPLSIDWTDVEARPGKDFKVVGQALLNLREKIRMAENQTKAAWDRLLELDATLAVPEIFKPSPLGDVEDALQRAVEKSKAQKKKFKVPGEVLLALRARVHEAEDALQAARASISSYEMAGDLGDL